MGVNHTGNPRWLVIEEYNHFRDPRLSQAENCRRVGEMLGMKWQAVERAVLREKRGE